MKHKCDLDLVESAYRAGLTAEKARKSSWAAKRARPGWKAKMAAGAAA